MRSMIHDSLTLRIDVVLIDLPSHRHESYAFSVPLTSVYSFIVYPPSFSSWCEATDCHFIHSLTVTQMGLSPLILSTAIPSLHYTSMIMNPDPLQPRLPNQIGLTEIASHHTLLLLLPRLLRNPPTLGAARRSYLGSVHMHTFSDLRCNLRSSS